jgi:short-subunit dehydrogenase
MRDANSSLAVVTGASTGIGYELGVQCVKNGFDLVVAANEPSIHDAAADFRKIGGDVRAIEVDLSTIEGVERLCDVFAQRPVDLLFANAGHGLGKGFLDQDFASIEHVVDTNIRGTIYLVYRVGRQMRERGRGRIMITGSMAGYVPGAYQAVYNGTKAFLDSFSFALREELKGSGVVISCLMPGATATRFYDRAELADTKAGRIAKADPADVAKRGFEALMRGDGGVFSGWKDRCQATIARILPPTFLADQYGKWLKPGSGSP